MHPNHRSTGQIEETVDTQTGRLDLPPFADTGKAESYFDVFFEVEIGGRVLHAHDPKRMESTITHKPPREWEIYEGRQVIELFDEHENPTGITIATTTHIPKPVEVDEFPDSEAEVVIQTPRGPETVAVSGPTTVHVWVGREGQADDGDGNELDEVATEIVALELTGTSSQGPVTVRRRHPSMHPNHRSTGQIEETVDTQTGRLDLPPFADTG
ncbi:MAG: hypothetical protein GY928_26335, partial [Colwellia sp.]|nr:hypothetical protein [Colwellia sp.]